MSAIRTILPPSLAAFALVCWLPGQAATVYKTVDANGVVSYSDMPPESDVPVETLEIDVRAPQPSESEQERLQAMRETTDRMAEDRREREKHRAELRQQQIQSQPSPQYPGSDDPQYLGYSSGFSGYYPAYPIRRPGRFGRRPRPAHPIARPPLRPPVQGHHSRPLSSRPIIDYPASLIRRHYSPQVRAAFEK